MSIDEENDEIRWRLIDRIYLLISKIFDLIDPETRKEKKYLKQKNMDECELYGFEMIKKKIEKMKKEKKGYDKVYRLSRFYYKHFGEYLLRREIRKYYKWILKNEFLSRKMNIEKENDLKDELV